MYHYDSPIECRAMLVGSVAYGHEQIIVILNEYLKGQMVHLQMAYLKFNISHKLGLKLETLFIKGFPTVPKACLNFPKTFF